MTIERRDRQFLRTRGSGRRRSEDAPSHKKPTARFAACRPMKMFTRIIVLVFGLGVAAAAGTGFGGDWFAGRMTGWTLLAHLAVAPLVLGGAAAAAVVWGRGHRFDASDSSSRLRRVVFWLLMACVLAVGGTMLAGMFPLVGASGMAALLEWHERAGLATTLCGGAYAALCILERIGKEHAR
ncbi:MAG: hypothetical protein D6744_17275 [Planctomycetota bacterium]|nr:MAG: hypothetical protein D6744_17275 [Planctomycetota bacterium]